MTTESFRPLFEHVAAAYADSADGRLDNAALYRAVAERAGIDDAALKARAAIGRSGQLHSPVERAIRWHTQTLKHMGVIQRVDGERGVWELVERTRKGLHVPAVPVKLVAFSTRLGVAIWGDNRDVLANIDEPIALTRLVRRSRSRGRALTATHPSTSTSTSCARRSNRWCAHWRRVAPWS